MDERNRDRRLDARGDLVHRVGRHDQELGPRGFETLGGIGQVLAGGVPLLGADDSLDVAEVDAPDEEVPGVVAPQRVVDARVDAPIVLDRRGAAHPAEDAHGPRRLSG